MRSKSLAESNTQFSPILNTENNIFDEIEYNSEGKPSKTLFAHRIQTPLGPMITLGDEASIYLLEFSDLPLLADRLERIKRRYHCSITKGSTKVITSLESQLEQYFAKQSTSFTTSVLPIGTLFQQKVWKALTEIPYGTTLSYEELAIKVGNPKGCRAVARANATNQFPILIPCHRVINKNGALGGFASGIMRKQRLLELEGKL